MKLKIFSVLDSKVKAFGQPFFQRTHGEAERSFTQVVRDPKSSIHPFPEDYDLYFLGEYDDQTGTVEPLDTPQHVVKAVQLATP